MKKISAYLIILSLIIGSLPIPVMAQIATDSANQVQASSSANTTPFDDVFVNSSLAPTNNTPSYIVPLVFPSFDTGLPGSANLSTNQNKKWAVALSTKHDFKGDETYQVNINDISPQNVQAQVFDVKGNLVSVDLEKISSGNGTSIQILPPKNFKPGKYTLKLTDVSGQTQTQDFTWGVLAINTDKSIYLSSEALAKEGLPPETANLAMAVLDDTGNMVCDALLRLEIKAPDGQITTLSTDNGKITINPECQIHDYTINPDYQAFYQIGGVGIYNLILTADTKNGIRTITDSFQVQNGVPFDVTRQTGTRIYPPARYPVNLNIKVNQDFKGQIIDYVPSSFQIFQATNGASFTVKDIAAPVASSTNTFGDFLKLGLPYKGSVEETLGFGQHILDPLERDLYAQFGLSGHDGLDFKMPIGTPIYSADDGTVVMAGGQIYGTTVVIQHSWGRSYYGHLSKAEVTLGQTISKGQEIALSGNTGITTGPHLHFSIKFNSNDNNNGYYGKTDPSIYLGLSNNSAVLGTSTVNDTIKAIVWDVNVKKGDILNLSYFFKTPNVSPYFYTLGPLSFYNNSQDLIFQEVRQWQLANDVVFPATSYVSSTASTKITTTTSWQVVTSAPASANTTTIASSVSNKTLGLVQWQPGVSNATVVTTAPTTPSGKGWIYDTALNSTIASGTWTFYVQTQSDLAINSTNVVTVCAWKVTLLSGAINSSVNIIPCANGSTNITAGTTLLASSVAVSGVSQVSFGENEYLYVEYWENETVAGGGKPSTANITFQVNAGTLDRIVTPGASSNQSPAAPSQDSPTNGQTGVSTTPTFLMTSASDAESNNLQYKVTIYSDACTTAVQTNDQSSSQTGWTGQNATCSTGSDCYTPNTQASYLTQTALSNSTTYYWRASVKDPLGLNTFVNSSTCNNFTTQSSGPTLDQLLRHGAWFSSGVEQPFTF